MTALLVAPVVLVAGVRYGDETSYRILLFALPWAIAAGATLFFDYDAPGRVRTLIEGGVVLSVTVAVLLAPLS